MSSFSAQTVHKSAFKTQVFSTVRRQLIQKRRAAFTAILELFIPVVFAAVLAVVADIAGDSDVPAKQFIDPSVPTPLNVSGVIDNMICAYQYSIQRRFGLLDCYDSDVRKRIKNMTCSWRYYDGSGWQQVPYGFCYSGSFTGGPDNAPLILFGLITNKDQHNEVMDMRTQVILGWIVNDYFGPTSQLIFTTPDDARIASLRVCGQLYFAPNTPFVRSMVRKLREDPFFDYVYGGIYNSRDEFLPWALSSAGEGRVWALIEIDENSDTSDLGVMISMNQTVLPSTTSTVNTFSRGLGGGPYTQYAASGYLAIQKLISDYWEAEVAQTRRNKIASFDNNANKSSAKKNGKPSNNSEQSDSLKRQATPVTAGGEKEIISVAPMGYPTYMSNSFFSIAGRIGPLVQVLSFLYTVSQLAKRLVEEKEQRLREGTMIMGLGRVAFFTSWMSVYYAQVTVTVLISSAILNAFVLTKSDFTVIFFLYLLFGLNIVNVSALLATFFNKSRIAALVVPLLYFMLSIPSFALPTDTAPFVFVVVSWIPTTPFSIGNLLLFNYQTTIGITSRPSSLANLNDNNPYNMMTCYAFLGLTGLLFPALMLYFDSVLPKEWGSMLHPCFCCLWFCRAPCCRKRRELNKKRKRLNAGDCDSLGSAQHIGGDSSDSDDEKNIISSPLKHMRKLTSAGIAQVPAVDSYPAPNAEATVHIKRARKEFDSKVILNGKTRSKKVAVDDVDLRLFPNSVTVLLGHNGAGKTTLMNMVTGMLDMTSGDVSVYGDRVSTDLESVRSSIGYCPQHNILWDDLTCMEHLQYFARLKGVPSDQVDSEALRLLERVDLLEKRNVFSSSLSGGQKRKLSVAIAFIGGSRFILLDEPTAGMDVGARWHTWDVILEMAGAKPLSNANAAGADGSPAAIGQEAMVDDDVVDDEKARLLLPSSPDSGAVNVADDVRQLAKQEGRTILLTTHFMDEADLLGSRVAIMSKGRLHSYGSPMFLKSKLGNGYVLRVSIPHTATTSASIVASKLCFDVLAEVQTIIPKASLREVKGQEVAILLEKESAPLFPRLLERLELESVKAQYGISGVSMTVSSLEDVFLKIAEENDEDDDPTTPTPMTSPTASAEASGDSTNVNSEKLALQRAFEVLEASRTRHQDDIATGKDKGCIRGISRGFLQFRALMAKRFHFARRDRRTICFQLAMPIVSLLIAMLLAYLKPPNLPALWLDEGMYSSRKMVQMTAVNPFGVSTRGGFDAANDDAVWARFEDGYRAQGYGAVESHNMSTTLAFSEWLLGTYDEHGGASMERFTAISPMMPSAAWWDGGKYAYTAVFTNASAPHSAPQAISAYYNSKIFAKQTAASSSSAPVSSSESVSSAESPQIKFGSHPFPFTDHQMQQIDAVKQMLVALFVMIPFTFIPSTYVAFIVKERQCKAKHLQFVSGVHYTLYWLANLVFDGIAYAFTAGCSIAIFFIFKREEFIGTDDAIKATVSVMLMYGVSGIAAAYCVSFFFTSHSAAQNTVMIVNFMVGFCLVVANFIMQKLPQTDYTVGILVYVFRCWPAFCLGEGIMNIALTSTLNVFLDDSDKKSLFDTDVIGSDIMFMGAFSGFFLLLTLVIDHPLRKERQRQIGFRSDAKAPLPAEEVDANGAPLNPPEDSDVIAEREAIMNTSNDNGAASSRADDVIIVRGLRKVYAGTALNSLMCCGKKKSAVGGHSVDINGSEKVAVRNITFGVHPGEVFGFLGTNGAGKTTTMGVMTGEFVPTMGEVTVCGFDVVKNASEAFQVIGYCPQFDALLDLLTPAEHLNLFAGLRGIPSKEIDAVVDALITVCGLDEFRKVPSMSLSGGNKRKLSVAISLMGHPKLVFLDEPSAGMDPHARRQLWDVISFIAKQSSVLLTTHHLEEVDVLAHRVAIMDGGLLRCLGTLEHLKKKFGNGFELTLRIANERFETNAVQFVKDNFIGSVLVESREQRLVFEVPSTATTLANLFTVVQAAVDASTSNNGGAHGHSSSSSSRGIIDYIVQQTSLETVFMRITNESETNEGDTAAEPQ